MLEVKEPSREGVGVVKGLKLDVGAEGGARTISELRDEICYY
jgi:hypothetical protein